MKKLLLSIIVGSCMMTSTNVSAQAVEEGNMLIDVYYGFPNLYTTVFESAYANSGSEEDLKISGFGPLGGRFEYMVADKFGIGVDVNYQNSIITYSEFDSFDNATYEYEFSTKRLTIMPTFNFHFIESNDNLDVYATIGAGWKNRTFEFTSTDPNYTEDSQESLVPVSFRIAAGMRYFFTDNIGINTQIGFGGGGGIFNAGLSLKF